MKLTKSQLKQIIKEEINNILEWLPPGGYMDQATKSDLEHNLDMRDDAAGGDPIDSENVGSFHVISPDGKVFNVKKKSRTHGDIDPQKAINLVATVTKRGQFGDYRVYEVPQEGGPPEGEPILTGKPED